MDQKQIDRLLALKKEIETAKTEKSKLEGQLEEKFSQLKSQFSVSDLASAETLLIEKEDCKIDKGQLADSKFAALQAEFSW